MMKNTMEKFKEQLNDLLTQYPDIGEFTIHIRPRVTIESAVNTGFTKQATGTPPEVKKEKASKEGGIAALEASVTKERMEQLSKLSLPQ